MKNYNLRSKSFKFLVIVFSFSFFASHFCEAAVLYLEPTQGEYYQEDIFITEVRLNTEEEYINTAEVNLTFPQDILEVRDFSKGNAVLTLWVEEPGFSNQAGTISFAGGIPGGYQGEDGLLGRIIFRAKEKGRAEVRFQETSQLLLNDGFGTIAEREVKTACFNILEKIPEVSPDEWQKEIESDSFPPESFQIEVQQDPSIFGNKYFIVFSTTDKQTGLDYFEIKEGERDWGKGVSPYLLEDQTLESIIKVKAVDKAGNERISQYTPPSRAWPFWVIILVAAIAGVLVWIIIKIKRKKKRLNFMIKERESFSKKIIWFSIGLIFLSGLCSARPVRAAGASLYLSPPSGTYRVGNVFSARVKIDSGGDTVNAAEGRLVFNPNELNVTSISKTGSILSLWTTGPTFSNSAGNVIFGGGTPSGFSGSAGTLIIITFRVRSVGSSNVNFSSGSVLAADGKGTNILANMQGGAYVLKSTVVIPPAPAPETEYVPPAVPSRAPVVPVLNSNTHPEPDKWYSNNSPDILWELSSGVGAVKLLMDKKSTSLPTELYVPPVSEKKFENLEDGVWYFHIQMENRYGWGGIIHRKVLIDTSPPEPFEIQIDNEGDDTSPRPILYFKTNDSPSGIAYYEVKIGEGERIPITAAYLEDNPYRLPLQAPGTHTILVEAVDAAGNSTIASTDLIVQPIKKPIIIECPKALNIEDLLTIEGISEYPGAVVSVFVKKEGKEVKKGDVKTDERGNWLFVYEESLDRGTYQAWAQITDTRGARSESTPSITIGVALPSVLKFGKIAIDYLAVIITLIALIVVLILIIFYGWRRISLLKKGIRKETKEAEESLQQGFKNLRDELKQQISYFDGKPGLNRKERKIRSRIQRKLNASEKVIGKEIKDIRRELTKRPRRKFRILMRKKKK